MRKIVIVTGGFDPIHSGHIEYFKAAKQLGDVLVVGLNSDEWLTRKKGQPFLSLRERTTIVENLKMVDHCITYDDTDDSSIDAIVQIRQKYPYDQIIFANGGDRNKDNIPEMSVVDDNLRFEFSVGGDDKKNSSSLILEEWKNPKTIRKWGWYKVLDDKKIYKVKELVIQPGQKLSMQRHLKRAEHWFVLKGECSVTTEYNKDSLTVALKETNCYTIGTGIWHQGYNPSTMACHILEVQFGESCDEDDVERKDASS